MAPSSSSAPLLLLTLLLLLVTSISAKRPAFKRPHLLSSSPYEAFLRRPFTRLPVQRPQLHPSPKISPRISASLASRPLALLRSGLNSASKVAKYFIQVSRKCICCTKKLLYVRLTCSASTLKLKSNKTKIINININININLNSISININS